MLRTQRLVVPLRVLLVAVFAALVAAQVTAVLVQSLFTVTVGRSEELDPFHGLLVGVVVLVLACVEVVIVCTWRLLTMVRDDRIFSDHALVWVNTIIGATASAWVLVLVAFVPLTTAANVLSLTVLLLLVLVVGAAVGLLMVVLRALLRQATMLRVDLDGVI